MIDAVKDNNSLREDSVFTSIHHTQPASFITIYGRTPSVPFLGKESCHSWSEYDIHLNSEVFYLSGQMKEEQADCLDRMLQAVHTVPVVSESDSLLVVSGRERVDSCISKVIASPSHTLFDECVSIYRVTLPILWWLIWKKWQLPQSSLLHIFLHSLFVMPIYSALLFFLYSLRK